MRWDGQANPKSLRPGTNRDALQVRRVSMNDLRPLWTPAARTASTTVASLIMDKEAYSRRLATGPLGRFGWEENALIDLNTGRSVLDMTGPLIRQHRLFLSMASDTGVTRKAGGFLECAACS